MDRAVCLPGGDSSAFPFQVKQLALKMNGLEATESLHETIHESVVHLSTTEFGKFFGKIGNQTLHAHSTQCLHVVNVVHGPDVDIESFFPRLR